MINIKKILPFFLTGFVPPIYAEIVKPEFSGLWYDEVQDEYIDSCYATHWHYHLLSENKMALIQQLFANLPKRTDCQWQAPQNTHSEPWRPSDFPTDNNDYDQMMENPLAPRSERWESTCLDADHRVVDQVYQSVSPSYRCPENSRASFDYSGYILCSTRAFICVADVVGRKEMENKKLGGHLGLATFENKNDDDFGNYVMEVKKNKNFNDSYRPEPGAIKFNTLSNFVTTVPNGYWGEVYGFDENKKIVDYKDAYLTVEAGVKQRYFDPEYTSTSEWREGKYEDFKVYDVAKNEFLSQKGLIRGKFRSDTFVNYCYQKGMGIKLPMNSTLAILPINTFNSFLYKRTDVLESDQAFPPASILVNQPDKLRDGFVNDTIPELITKYENENNIINKIKLISAISEAATIFSHATMLKEENFSNQQKNNIFIAQKWLLRVLQTEQDIDLLYASIWHALKIIPVNFSSYQIVYQAMQFIQSFEEGKKILSIDKKYFILLSMAFSNAENQQRLLPHLFEMNLSREERKIYNEQLFFLIKQMQPAQMINEIKVKLKKYITSLAQSANQLYVLAIINSHNEEQKNGWLLRFLRDIKNDESRANFIQLLDPSVLMQIEERERKSLSQHFFSLFKNSHSLSEKSLYGAAFSLLKIT